MIELFRRLLGLGRSAHRAEPAVSPEEEPAPAPASQPEEVPEVRPFTADDLLAVTCIGYSHIKHGTVCQDSSLLHRGEGWRLVAVSDGHGSSSFPRSDRGSRIACRVAREACEDFVRRTPTHREEDARALCTDMVARWHRAVLADWQAHPFTPAELEGVSDKYRDHYRAGRQVEHAYGATLIAVLDTGAGVLALRCGDGECVAVDVWGEMTRPIPWNDKCDVNVTTSLCDAAAAEEFRWVWLDRMPAAIWIGTDGVDNSYPVAEQLDEFYANLSLRACEEGCGAVQAELERFLPVLTQRCSQDDVSVAGMVDVAGLALAKHCLAQRLERHKALREQEERRRQLKALERKIKETQQALARTDGADEPLQNALAQLRRDYDRLAGEQG